MLARFLQETVRNFLTKSYKLFDEFLVGNQFYNPSLGIKIASQSCPKKNIPWKDLWLKQIHHLRAPNCNIYNCEPKSIYTEKNTSQWLGNQSEGKRHEIVTNTMQMNNKVRNLEQVRKCEHKKEYSEIIKKEKKKESKQKKLNQSK